MHIHTAVGRIDARYNHITARARTHTRPSVAPYRPAAQGVGVATPSPHHAPVGQMAVQDAVLSPGVRPYRPAGQDVGTATPVPQYDPGGHTLDAFAEPAGQNDPAVQGVEQGEVAPATLLMVPAAHFAHERPTTDTYHPAAHGTHDAAPAAETAPDAQAAHADELTVAA